MVYRIYVEKRKEYKVEALGVLKNIEEQLKIKLDDLSIVNRYDLEGVLESDLAEGINTILSEPMVDDVYKD